MVMFSVVSRIAINDPDGDVKMTSLRNSLEFE